MTRRQVDKLLLGFSIGCFLAMSVSFLLMPVEWMGPAPGLIFWGGLVLGLILQIVLEIRRRSFFAQYHVNPRRMQKPRNGLLTFVSNPYAKVADCAFPVSLVGAVLAFIFTQGTGYVCYIFITLTVLSFCLHCVLNGRIFFHVINQNKVRQVLERKKADFSEKGEEKK